MTNDQHKCLLSIYLPSIPVPTWQLTYSKNCCSRVRTSTSWNGRRDSSLFSLAACRKKPPNMGRWVGWLRLHLSKEARSSIKARPNVGALLALLSQ